MNKGKLFVISGPSGSGKSTVIGRLLKELDKAYFSISATTREPREGERDGVDYHFMKKEEFEKLIDEKLKGVNEKLKLYETFFETIKHSYRFRLISLCEKYLERGYLTPKEYSQLNEMWGVYHGLRGNDQGDDYYHKAEKLPIHEHREGDKGN